MLRTLGGSFEPDLILGKNKVEMGKRGDYEHKASPAADSSGREAELRSPAGEVTAAAAGALSSRGISVYISPLRKAS